MATEPVTEEQTAFLFCDPGFRTDYNMLYRPLEETVLWLRPHELTEKPSMQVESFDRLDVQQGKVGDCWFMSACCSLAMKPELFKEVIPSGQVLYGPGYQGLLRFRFWKMGEWEEVTIDDRLPVDLDEQLYYGKCTDPEEFWLPLLEKAFAKFHGGYTNIKNGHEAEAFTALTSFVSETRLTMQWSYDELYEHLVKEFQNRSLVCAGRGRKAREDLEARHAYTVTGIKKMREDVYLVRVRNPWSTVEWSGDWSDKDKQWNEVDAETKEMFQYVDADDGEFWMDIRDFIRHFRDITVTYNREVFKEVKEVKSEWVKGESAGGSRRDMESFATNPQYLLTVELPETGDDPVPPTVLVELIQDFDRRPKDPKRFSIATRIYPAPDPAGRLTVDQLLDLKEVDGAPGDYEAYTSVVMRLQLQPGNYVLIPSTFERDESAKFLLRVHCASPILLESL